MTKWLVMLGCVIAIFAGVHNSGMESGILARHVTVTGDAVVIEGVPVLEFTVSVQGHFTRLEGFKFIVGDRNLIEDFAVVLWPDNRLARMVVSVDEFGELIVGREGK